ncbi:hypothetical protein M5K25_011238 [Dendrobium thyrsiflorum]|uniref:Uncharacterized protein n=1 Tax=Dendrobium thyrsiflorum TaxID=117978 RepID=A0ABD0V2P3_DENTH
MDVSLLFVVGVGGKRSRCEAWRQERGGLGEGSRSGVRAACREVSDAVGSVRDNMEVGLAFFDVEHAASVKDPQGIADIRDMLEQHQDMLRGHDTFHSFFTRSPLLPEYYEDSVEFEDPDRWVTSLRLQCGEYHLLESSVAQIGWGTCNVLTPIANTVEPVGQSSLLSCHQTVSGLLVFGHSFEKCVPPNEQLFCQILSVDGDRRGRLTLPDIYPVLIQHYGPVYRASGLSVRARVGMPVDIWICSFFQHSYLTTVGASLYDPFGLDLQRDVPLSEETAEPSSVASHTSPALPNVSEDLFLAGFLTTWLCTFLLPLRVGFVRYSALLAITQLSVGQRLSMAPTVLVRI